MGLDISFSKDKALEAGLILQIERRGSLESIAEYHNLPLEEQDPEHLKWLLSPETVATVNNGISGGMKTFYVDDYMNDNLVIRANKWGNNYAPLTLWLTTHNITWDEF